MKKSNYYATERKMISKKTGEEFVLLIEATNIEEAKTIAEIITKEQNTNIFPMRRAEITDLTGYGKIAVAKRGFIHKVIYSFSEEEQWKVTGSKLVVIGEYY